MRIHLLEPYLTGSHAAWAHGYVRHSAHEVSIISLPGRWWKWRMHGAAVTLATEVQRQWDGEGLADLLLATDMLDLASFLALTRSRSAEIPVALYMHENQLTYPMPSGPQPGKASASQQEQDLHYAFINYTSMLVADAVFFNSQFHRDDWFDALGGFLRRLPDFRGLDTVPALYAKSQILPLGLDLQVLDSFKPSTASKDGSSFQARDGGPLVLWNHRWEYDKDPTTFFRALCQLASEGERFRVAVCGEDHGRAQMEFTNERKTLGNRIVTWGKIEKKEDYARLLWDADIVVSTAHHEFFGAAIVEAIYCGCRPILPHKLAYPEHIPQELWPNCLYTDYAGLLTLLRRALHEPRWEFKSPVSHYDWGVMAPSYDAAFERLAP